MSLELLANEILLNLFEYFNGVDLFRAFYDLNSRFNRLLIVHFRIHIFDFHLTSKHDFDLICRQYLPLITDRIVTLHLSNTDETPCQIDLFLLDDCTFLRFIHLRSLSFRYVCSNILLTKIIFQCRHLLHLTCLRFIECFFERCCKTHYDTINSIWTLPKLTHCLLDFKFLHNDQTSFMPISVSKSIKHVSLPPVNWQLNQFVELFRCTPNIRHLDARMSDGAADGKQLKSPVQSIIALNLFVSQFSKGMFNLLQNMPNLLCLIVKTSGMIINGDQWKQIIVDHLLKLKIFKICMRYQLNNRNDKEKEIDRLLDSYRTSYWLKDRQWFVRCQWTPNNTKSDIFLYSLPDLSDYFVIQPSSCTIRTKSTCPWEYDYEKDDDHASHLIHLMFTHICFSNIRHLHLTLPFTDILLSDLPRFDRLIILQVGCFPLIDTNMAGWQLQNLINRALYLYSLEILAWFPLIIQEIPLNLTSHSIRSLCFQNACCSLSKIKTYFDDQRCSALIRSPLAIQCEFLSIIVNKRKNILDLVNGLPNLRALNIQCQDDKWKNKSTLLLIDDDELVEWLRTHLSCVINRDRTFTECIHLWIR
ncbi:unnamed protein product [Rotaria sp. Silwood2]|nr:unnamed protein product [Rotaria sp. Silwood2]